MENDLSTIDRVDNRIVVAGELADFHKFLAIIHNIVERLGYSDVVLDLSQCTSAFQNSLLSLCAQVLAYRKAGISFDLVPPTDKKLANLFRNTNWGYFLDPRRFEPSAFRGHSQVPATQYQTPAEQQAAVNRIVNVMLGALPGLNRSDFAALEWAVNEITDNVLVHSQSPIGGLVQVSTFIRGSKRVQFVVADAGIGIPRSLRSGRQGITSDTEALDLAIREGVTRDASIGQGNGMYGSYEICSKSRGDFLVDSGNARLRYLPSSGLSIAAQNIPYSGTLVVATIDFSDPRLLEDALRFKGVKYTPVDYVDLNYASNPDGAIHFKLVEESTSFGSRVSGKPIQTKLLNLARMAGTSPICVDFERVPLLSSSFADEAFGKVFLSLGPIAFMQRIRLHNMSGAVEGLVNRAIAQRMQVGHSDADT
jgi:anti-sigma regulatory factor (Ser/Thr protein kinase)